ncbi:MAG: PH domain-containing protein [Chloroflexi bacterium]|nr:PH domain-containing protein [Chloroflexota bacterium]
MAKASVPESSPLRQELKPGEDVLWEGRPVQWFFVLLGSPAGLFVASFSLLWFALGLLLFYSIWFAPLEGEAPDLLVRGLALAFLLAGCYFAFGRYVIAALEWRNTAYVLTNRRVMIQSGARGKTTHIVELAALRQVHGMLLAPGIGDIYLGEAPPFRGLVGRVPGWLPGGFHGHIPTIQSVQNAEAVYRAVLEAARKAAPPDAPQDRPSPL